MKKLGENISAMTLEEQNSSCNDTVGRTRWQSSPLLRIGAETKKLAPSQNKNGANSKPKWRQPKNGTNPKQKWHPQKGANPKQKWRRPKTKMAPTQNKIGVNQKNSANLKQKWRQPKNQNSASPKPK
jgi:hypothetical protein